MISLGATAVLGAAAGVYRGATAAHSVYLGATLVWRKLQAASASFPSTDIGKTTWRDFASWTADGWGPATVSTDFSFGSNGLQWVSHTTTVQITVNGAVVQTTSTTRSTGGWSSSLTWSGQVSNGDAVKVQGWCSTDAAYTSSRTASATSSITPT